MRFCERFLAHELVHFGKKVEKHLTQLSLSGKDTTDKPTKSRTERTVRPVEDLRKKDADNRGVVTEREKAERPGTPRCSVSLALQLRSGMYRSTVEKRMKQEKSARLIPNTYAREVSRTIRPKS